MPVSDPVQEILSRLQGVKSAGQNQWEARCPAHDDRHASLSVGRGADGRALMYCQAGCSIIDIRRALDLPWSAFFPPGSSPSSGQASRIVATYDYRDASGELLFQVVRFEPKDFRQRKPDGSDGWVWELGDTPRVLYRLPELLATDPSQWVFIVEGEKDADNLATLGLVATCNPGGAGKWGKLSQDSALHGHRVVILPDKDDPGRKHAQGVAERLAGKAAEVRIVSLPGLGKDVSDWIAAGGTAEQLLALVESPAADDSAEPSRPTVLIDTEEHRVVCETVAALAADEELYHRGGILVRVLRDNHPKDGIVRPGGSPTIQTMPAANLRERMTRCATFVKPGRKGQEIPSHPAAWLVSAVVARGEWPQLRHLSAVSDAPVMRADGSIWQTPGYDERTGVLFESTMAFPPVHPEVGIDDAMVALVQLAISFDTP